ncbi:MAG: hypothetical protein ABW166_16870 [Sedimenticola sp.]
MNQDDSWRIVASGTAVEGADRDDIDSALKKRFGFKDADITKLLNGHQKVIKKGLDTAKAYKYKQALLAAGVDVRMEPMPRAATKNLSPTLSLLPVAEDATKQEADGDSADKLPSEQVIRPGEMQCPNCKHKQVMATECSSCGVIIARYRPNIATEESVEVPQNIGSTGLSLNLRTLAGVVAALLLITLFTIPKTYNKDRSPEAQAQAQALGVSRAHKWPKLSRLQNLVESGDYYAAERIIRQLHDQTMVDITWEDAYIYTVLNLTNKKGFSLDAMNRWVNSTGSAIAYLARGAHYSSAAGSARGSNWVSKTSDAQFAAQSKLALKSKRDLKKALTLNHELIPAYSMLVWLSTARGVKIDKEQVLMDAITAVPGTFDVRNNYINTIYPKWGGSHPAMEAFANDAVVYTNDNPRLWLLKGFIDEDKGNSAWMKNDCDDAIKYYTAALEYGVYPDWLNQRAHCLAHEGDYDQALADVSHTLEYYPKNSDALELKQWLEQQL